jgi:GNAT superfamily N-acetyltransferase
MLHIRSAYQHEADAVSRLMQASKAYWGYDEEFMQACHDELVVSEARCASGLVVVAQEDDASLAGFYELDDLSRELPEGELLNLFIAPEHIRKGIGTVLLREAMRHASTLGMTSLRIESDPYAEDFYLGMGAQRVGETPSLSIPGRVIPLLSLPITA